MKEHLETRLFHPSARPAGHGITIGTPRFYDTSQVLFFGGRRRAYSRLAAAAGVRRGQHVLDLGCGPGYFARMLADAVGPQGSVVGIDAAPEMIAYARRHARGRTNCTFEPGTAESIAFAEATFDVVVSSLMLHHLTEEGRSRAAAEMLRVLRPGGTLLLADFAIAERGAWRVVALLTGHGDMARRVPPLETLVAGAGFTELRPGAAPPWLRYVRATKPRPLARSTVDVDPRAERTSDEH